MSAEGMIDRAAGPGRAAPVRLPGHRPDDARATASGSSSRRCPGRELIAASLALRAGAADEPDAVGGATVLARPRPHRGHRGPRRHRPRPRPPSAWAPRSTPRPAGTRPPRAWTCRRAASRPRWSSSPRWCAARRSPAAEVERLRDERLTDLLQARGGPAPPRRRGVRLVDLRPVEPVPPARRRAPPRPSAGLTPDDAARRPRRRLRPVPGRARRRRRRGPRRGRPHSPRRCSATGAARTTSEPGPIDDTERGHVPRSCASSTGRVPSRPRSGSGTAGCRGSTPTSTPSR